MCELKSCPFCGGAPEMYSDKDPSMHGFIHLCKGYGEYMVKVESRLFGSEEKAAAAWNRREGETDEQSNINDKASTGIMQTMSSSKKKD